MTQQNPLLSIKRRFVKVRQTVYGGLPDFSLVVGLDFNSLGTHVVLCGFNPRGRVLNESLPCVVVGFNLDVGAGQLWAVDASVVVAQKVMGTT